MKPVGLKNPHDDNRRPYAVVQLRPDNTTQTLYNMVGFQTKMKHSSQVTIFQNIPGLENVRFARLGGIHRNTFINSPEVLRSDLSLKKFPHIHFAGQITGVEGYVESTGIGLLTALFITEKITKTRCTPPPLTTALGSLHNYILLKDNKSLFQPMNINFGLFKSAINNLKGKKNRRERYSSYTSTAKSSFLSWLESQSIFHRSFVKKHDLDPV